jgi:ribosomal protein S18 acetylase RimI-like enzyme
LRYGRLETRQAFLLPGHCKTFVSKLSCSQSQYIADSQEIGRFATMQSILAFREVHTRGDRQQVADLARVIWQGHYPAVITVAQIDYMLARFQSAEAIAEQISAGMRYWLVMLGNEAIGYLAAQKRGTELFISKFYLLAAHRGRGFGRQCMAFLAEYAEAQDAERLMLTVNKGNSSVAIYQRLGFVIDGPLVQAIGGGYVMDDFQMSRRTALE